MISRWTRRRSIEEYDLKNKNKKEFFLTVDILMNIYHWYQMVVVDFDRRMIVVVDDYHDLVISLDDDFGFDFEKNDDDFGFDFEKNEDDDHDVNVRNYENHCWNKMNKMKNAIDDD
jgi:hypothetical protein